MIEEDACVSEVTSGRVWIEKGRKSSCSGCAESCPSALAGDLLGEKRVRLSVRTDLPLSPGDKIVIGVAQDIVVKSSFLIYLLPLVGFFAGAWLGNFVVGSDLTSALAGLGGLGLCFFGLKALRLFDQERYQPVILRKID